MSRATTKPDTAGHALMGVAELAAYLGVPVRTVYDWQYQGVGPPSYRVGKYTRYRLAEVDRWLDARRNRCHAE